MKDNSVNLVAGILIHAELQRQNEAKHQEQKFKQEQLEEEIKEQSRNFAKKNELIEREKKRLKGEVDGLKGEVDDLESDVDVLRSQIVALVNHANNLQKQVNEYSDLLCKPLKEIAENNGNFKKTYEKQLGIIANWIVSQKAFKELAIQFGLEKGIGSKEVVELGNGKKIDVLENRNNPEHNTNAADSDLLTYKKIELIEEIAGNKNR